MNELQTIDEKPAELMRNATDIAGICKAIVVKSAVQIQNKKYVPIEGWMSIATAHGCCLSASQVEAVDGGIRAVGEVRRVKDGVIIATAEGFVGDDESTWAKRPMYARRAMAQCVTLDAEILTRRGFVPYNLACVGEDVLAYNPDDGECHWVPLRAVSVFESADVVRMRNRSIDFCATPDHSWVFNGHGLRPFNDAPYRGSILHAAPCYDAGTVDLSPDDAYLLGWAITDGSIRWIGNCVRVHIDQSKRKTVAKLIEATARVGAKVTVTPARTQTFFTGRTYALLPSHRFQINAQESKRLLEKANIRDKDDPSIVELVCGLSPEARTSMLTAMIEADGTMKKSGKSGMFGKQKEFVMEAFRLLCTLEGIAIGKMQWYNGMPRQTFRSHRVTYTPSLSVDPIGKHPVWCPTTEFGTWVMKQNGVVSITGNTRAMSRAARSAFAHVVMMMDAGLATTPAEEVPSEGFAEKAVNPAPSGFEVTIGAEVPGAFWKMSAGEKKSVTSAHNVKAEKDESGKWIWRAA